MGAHMPTYTFVGPRLTRSLLLIMCSIIAQTLAQISKFFKHKIVAITCVLGAQKSRLIETVLLSTHNMFQLINEKNNYNCALLFGGQTKLYKGHMHPIRTIFH